MSSEIKDSTSSAAARGAAAALAAAHYDSLTKMSHEAFRTKSKNVISEGALYANIHLLEGKTKGQIAAVMTLVGQAKGYCQKI